MYIRDPDVKVIMVKETPKWTIKEFNMRDVMDDSICVFIGKRRSGKSVLVTELMYYKRHFKKGVVMCGSISNVQHYSRFIPGIFVYNKFDIFKLKNIVEKHKKRRMKFPNEKMFILLDDCAYDSKALNSLIIKELFFNGRHHGILLIITMQYCLNLKPELRNNIDFTFLCHEKNPKTKEKLFDNFNPVFDKLADFNRVFASCTQNYECMVIDNAVQSSAISDNVFWYKATLNRNFLVGKKGRWWLYHKHNFKKDASVIANETEDVVKTKIMKVKRKRRKNKRRTKS